MIKLTPTSLTKLPVYVITIYKNGRMVTPTIAMSEEEIIAAFYTNVIISILDSGYTDLFYKSFKELNELFPHADFTAEKLYDFFEKRNLLDSMLTELNKASYGTDHFIRFKYNREAHPIKHGDPVVATADISFSLSTYYEEQTCISKAKLYCKNGDYKIKCHMPENVKSAILLAD